jgi:hypothetical protein
LTRGWFGGRIGRSREGKGERMAEGPSFDLSKMTTAAKIVMVGGILYLINLFLPWNKACFGGGSIGGVEIPSACASVNGLHGLGVINLILVLVIIVMEIIIIMGLENNMPMEAAQRQMVGAGLVGLLIILTLLKILVDNEALSWPAWLGLILSGVMGYGAFMRFQEAKTSGGDAGGLA